MAQITITDLPQKAALSDTDYIVIDSGTVTNKVTIAQLKELLKDTFVQEAGDEMSGPLKIPTPDLTADDTTVVNASWVGGKIIDKVGDKLVPVGALMMGPIPSMAGYLLCDGRAVSRTQYAALFAMIGTNFGVGDGSSTFNVPDYRGCFLRGQGGDSDTLYQKQPMGAPDATGHIVLGWQNGEYTASGVFTKKVDGYVSPDGFKNYNSGYDFALSTSNSVYGAASEIRPVNFAVNYFIKY